MDRAGNFLPPYVSTRNLATFLSALLLFTAAMSAVSAGFEISEIQLVSSLIKGVVISSHERWSHGVTRIVIATLRGVLLAGAAVAFIVWLHRARVNARAFGCRRFRYSRSWTISGFLIPLANFVIPFQVISEVWRASDPRAVQSPTEWKVMPVPRILPVWWVLLLGSGALALLSAGLITSFGVDLPRVRVARGICVVADLAASATAVLGYLVVSRIATAQDRKWWILNGGQPLLGAPEEQESETPLGSPAPAGF